MAGNEVASTIFIQQGIPADIALFGAWKGTHWNISFTEPHTFATPKEKAGKSKCQLYEK